MPPAQALRRVGHLCDESPRPPIWQHHRVAVQRRNCFVAIRLARVAEQGADRVGLDFPRQKLGRDHQAGVHANLVQKLAEAILAYVAWKVGHVDAGHHVRVLLGRRRLCHSRGRPPSGAFFATGRHGMTRLHGRGIIVGAVLVLGTASSALLCGRVSRGHALLPSIARRGGHAVQRLQRVARAVGIVVVQDRTARLATVDFRGEELDIFGHDERVIFVQPYEGVAVQAYWHIRQVDGRRVTPRWRHVLHRRPHRSR
mmetsp:Transcript_110947/g.312797  ORF Transcript_110947/g.312797 Transcript_110947/m.312797 type:complete len:256 (-) Transcript_110947:982-1749(-)